MNAIDISAKPSVAQLALNTGLSKSTVSRVLRGEYPKDTDAHRRVIAALGSSPAPAEVAAARPYIPGEVFTTTGQQLLASVLEAAIEDAEWVIVDGPSGLGKSYSLNTFQARHPDAILMKAKYGQSVGAVLESLCRAFEVPVSGTNETRQNRILEAAAGRVLVVDEADLLASGAMGDRVLRVLELFREIYEAGAAVILAGLPELPRKLAQNGETYVFRRIGYFRSIQAPSPEELARFFIHSLPDVPLAHAKAGLAASQARKNGLFGYLAKLAKRTRLLDGDVEAAMSLLFRPEV